MGVVHRKGGKMQSHTDCWPRDTHPAHQESYLTQAGRLSSSDCNTPFHKSARKHKIISGSHLWRCRRFRRAQSFSFLLLSPGGTQPDVPDLGLSFPAVQPETGKESLKPSLSFMLRDSIN